MDIAYRDAVGVAPEIKHHYGPAFRLIRDPLAWTWLSRMCAPDTRQPTITELVRYLYRHLLHYVVATRFPTVERSYETRMITSTEHGRWTGRVVDPDNRVICVDIARAGIVPSQVCFEELLRILPDEHVRQDHIIMNRATDDAQRVTGAEVFGQKIGGPIADRIVLFPDPMGATGSSICRAATLYAEAAAAPPASMIALHLIVTPEYLRRVKDDLPELEVFAFRLDRGLSAPDVLATTPGERWAEERGLNDIHYIVPGAGGLGELLNNAER